MTRCAALTIKGERCNRQVVPYSHYCKIHLREKVYFEKDVESLFEIKNPKDKLLSNSIFQVILALLFFVIIYILFKNDKLIGSYISIPTDTAKEFFLVISQIIASILGFYIAIIILSVQLFGTESSKAFDLVQEKLERVSELIFNMPSELHILKDDYHKMLDDLHDEVQIMKDDKKIVSFENIANRLKRMLKVIKAQNLRHDYITHINSYFWNIERIFQKSLIPYIGSIAIKKSSKIIIKLLLLLGISLLLYLVFGIIDVKNIFPNLNAPILFSFILYIILILIEFFGIVYILFENLRDWR